MDKINIKRLAEELNLSTSTISRALQDSYQIGAETKQRVLDLAKKLNYVPNPHASSLGSRKSHMIAVVIPEVFDSYFAQAINGIESVTQEKGYHVLIYMTHEQFAKEQAILNTFHSGRVDGVILSVSAETKDMTHIQTLHEQQVPVVLFDRVGEALATSKVTTDNREGGYAATKHLLERGCRNIAFLSISRDLSIGRWRLEGHHKALRDYDLPINEHYIIDCTESDEVNGKLIKAFLRKHPEVDGLIATVEKLTISAYQACSELHLRIPEEVKVISFSNSRSAPWLNPSLTTITQPAFEMGKAAATMLCKALKHKNPASVVESVILPSQLIVRQSTGVAI
ncbi:LacI family DNA-binding transcriptional regulator [Hymenobacter sp.]|jgi:LacI family transcriptional regulator|uniref:LacI family DNA-binding transcriptional regulator n=1 Tax=Hymenobacter sp. TaxID=1898978 RepID=UPI002ED9CAEB